MHGWTWSTPHNNLLVVFAKRLLLFYTLIMLALRRWVIARNQPLHKLSRLAYSYLGPVSPIPIALYLIQYLCPSPLSSSSSQKVPFSLSFEMYWRKHFTNILRAVFKAHKLVVGWLQAVSAVPLYSVAKLLCHMRKMWKWNEKRTCKINTRWSRLRRERKGGRRSNAAKWKKKHETSGNKQWQRAPCLGLLPFNQAEFLSLLGESKV